MKHTQGKWFADSANNIFSQQEKGRIEKVAVCGMYNIQDEANAKLIASAPEMLEGLIKIFNQSDNGYIKRIAEKLIKQATE